jgi:hypothetical protein
MTVVMAAMCKSIRSDLEMAYTHVFRVLIHIEVVEDLLFYHYSRAELMQDGKIPWREFSWQYGKTDDELYDEELHPPTMGCGQEGRTP